ncbi:hypothetical protein dhabil_242 [Escherichia phage dhabil]|nr:hypothetical protein dhabil_242 [Escherichia phage dhabil]
MVELFTEPLWMLELFTITFINKGPQGPYLVYDNVSGD